MALSATQDTTTVNGAANADMLSAYPVEIRKHPAYEEGTIKACWKA
jgi:hypothetical protein